MKAWNRKKRCFMNEQIAMTFNLKPEMERTSCSDGIRYILKEVQWDKKLRTAFNFEQAARKEGCMQCDTTTYRISSSSPNA